MAIQQRKQEILDEYWENRETFSERHCVARLAGALARTERSYSEACKSLVQSSEDERVQREHKWLGD